jgi:hypothetical protein
VCEHERRTASGEIRKDILKKANARPEDCTFRAAESTECIRQGNLACFSVTKIQDI